ncbi:MAG TPA: Holliday junction branch migration protein RuvA [Candidatus Saccharimonadales bacterium]|jgi:Holliday junction DNA helicase RuvA|nr:Holliday junction branch migration protein RuvA [Candidatus Saccharimonadales bacterium]
MIAMLTGRITEKALNAVVVDVQGVGYGVFVVHEDQGQLTGDQTATLYIYEHIRENSHDLYGFLRIETKQLFERLIEVNGVGPKVALSLLSIGSTDTVRQAIASGNTKLIQAAPGIGKRVAERIVVDLKDKVGLAGVDITASGLLQSEAAALQDDAVAALLALGFSVHDAMQALQPIDSSLPTEQRVTRALRNK